MSSRAAILKQEIEAKLAHRVPAALSPLAQQAPRLHPTGNPALDFLLGGGLPLGSVCELTGPDGSGRSSIALSLLAEASPQAACAYVDVQNVLSPHSAAADGVRLSNLLWVRFAEVRLHQDKAANILNKLPLEKTGKQNERIQQNCGGPHPRGETKGLAPALEQMLLSQQERRRRKMEGKPGYPNQPLGLSAASQDQIEWERFNLRRVDENDPLRQQNQQSAAAARVRSNAPMRMSCDARAEPKLWNRLDRALRATDQILQSGGFRVVVLDLGSVAPEQAYRIPSATWFRFRRAAQESDALVLLITQEPCARSSAACVLQCSPGAVPTVQGVLTAARNRVEAARQRTGSSFAKKAPGRATHWSGAPAWMRAVGQ